MDPGGAPGGENSLAEAHRESTVAAAVGSDPSGGRCRLQPRPRVWAMHQHQSTASVDFVLVSQGHRRMPTLINSILIPCHDGARDLRVISQTYLFWNLKT